ncbi:MAG TPA: endonuclease MutS2 [Anaerolineaceae bacterium]|nr:endonuclease MutS2 [Anaerolineaceae bacterium]
MMDSKALQTLEFPKVLDRLAGYASFSASADLARALRPTDRLDEAHLLQQQTSEARRLLDTNSEASVGGAHDIRPLVDLANHGGVLQPVELLDVKSTLIAARSLGRVFERQEDLFPILSGIAALLPPPPGLVDAISRTISERGEVMDSASDKLAAIRREIKVSYDRLMSKLERMINDPKTAPMLQEGLITQRNGRYVVPLRAEFKGRVRSIVHDQSASGATLFVEPIAVVDLNNQYREAQLAERDEERRILTELSRQVGEHARQLEEIVEALAQIDLAFAKAKYAEDLRASEPVLRAFRSLHGTKHPGSVIKLYNARHPLLDPATVVPIDVYLDEDIYSLVITGPNTGGKTVTLKTVGLLALMAQSGMHIPAQSGSELSVFDAIFADIGDEQSIEQSLSTFSGHITNIIHILARAERHSLVLLDELGAGTDPQEGAALARAILLHIMDQGVTNLVATHYPELKTFAHATPGMVNASVEFDVQTLRPTYHLTIGLPGRSNALAIAERLGLPEDIIAAARGSLSPEELRAEDLLNEIHHQRDQARRARAEAEQIQRDAEARRAELSMRLEKIEDERRQVLEKARAEAEEKTAALETELEEVRRALARARQPLEALKPAEEKVEELAEKVQKPVERKRSSVAARQARGPLRLGEKVRLRSLKMEGVVTGLGQEEVEVQVGVLRVRTRLSDIQRGEEEPSETNPQQPAPQAARPAAPPAPVAPAIFRASPGMELDLRGQRAEDALDALDRHLESAYLAGLPFVRIIHGKGTGRLRQVVHEALRDSPHVTSFEMGGENEGGDGVTVAKLAS